MTVNLHADEWDERSDKPGWQQRVRSLREPLGGEDIGASLYELDPGARSCPYHFHYAEEEWLIVVSGEPTLRTPEGERTLREGDVVAFRRGPEGAHVVANNTDSPLRVLILSTLAPVEVCVYPDSDKVGAWAAERGADRASVHLMNREDANLPYLDGEE